MCVLEYFWGEYLSFCSLMVGRYLEVCAATEKLIRRLSLEVEAKERLLRWSYYKLTAADALLWNDCQLGLV